MSFASRPWSPCSSQVAMAVAYDCLHRALRVATPNEDRPLALTFSNIGFLQLQRQKPSHAARYLRRAIRLDEFAADPATCVRSKLNLSNALIQLDDPVSALANAQSAYQVTQIAQNTGPGPPKADSVMLGGGEASAMEGNLSVLSCLALSAIAVCHQALGNLEKAHMHAKMALRLSSKALGSKGVLFGRILQQEQTLKQQREGVKLKPASLPKLGAPQANATEKLVLSPLPPRRTVNTRWKAQSSPRRTGQMHKACSSQRK